MRNLRKEVNIESLNLRRYRIFKGLLPNDFDLLYRDMVCNVYKKGELVYNEGSRINGVYIVCDGIVKIYKTGYESKEQIIKFAKEGDLIAFRSVITEDVACTTAEILQDAILCYINAETLITLFKNNSEFALNLMKLSCKELGEANKFLTNLAQKTVRERLAEVLLLLMDTFELDPEDYSLKICLTREEIANMVGTATESIIRLLSEFKNDKLIDIDGRKIKLLNIPKLIKIGNVYNN
jgi:CRP-like cAMP-binding protein